MQKYSLSKKLSPSVKFIVGIDEAGRGPLAGPVTVGAVVILATENLPNVPKENLVRLKSLLMGARDSKQLSSFVREEWFKKIKKAERDGVLGYSVACVSSKVIDSRGIIFAVNIAIKRILKKLSIAPHQTMVLLDGGIFAPKNFLYQKTIIRGDQTEPVISMASIIAKVTRDRKMIQYSKKYPEFGFEIHKGYGTLCHRKKIKKYGLCEIHRVSFLSRFLA